MPHWDPGKIWEGEDSYVIGGGFSLESFDWDLIRDRNVIGCNGSYIHGAHVVKIVVFGDILWWEKVGKRGLEEFGGVVIACSSKLRSPPAPWIFTMGRGGAGLHTDRLGWNGNTGSLAVNLALILGAKRVFLLGFDMKLGKDKDGVVRANYHHLRYEPPKAIVYTRFIRGFGRLAHALPTVFPGCEIWNVTDDSAMDVFPKVSLQEHFNGKVVNCGRV